VDSADEQKRVASASNSLSPGKKKKNAAKQIEDERNKRLKNVIRSSGKLTFARQINSKNTSIKQGYLWLSR